MVGGCGESDSREMPVHREQGTKPQAEQPVQRKASPENAAGSGITQPSPYTLEKVTGRAG